ncbi:Bifunctional NMN adenylyltransferase/Nudix hydrolase [Roseivivax sp. THAF40]|uniref:NUDIX domain-containing protein n=1 Tax=unclassified Roseivivax TaxID=2639302 RepID=UPI0012692EEC|nr:MULTISPECIES: NUDIX domain-containing protein [unclassified Roseivivax]QFS82643.1 Bifunctional NMN adenylyltransferase/Nudix hydrolase [Roseivivax sp. THAF197b]QFT46412.1 Bifunctional NMN adenylyltransferase/Nudix hydrolase [Roseivivax sp. THAF40]
MRSVSRKSEPTPAALAVVIREGHALLVRRGNRPDAGLWGYPGGKCEAGESAAETALRELGEETGLVATRATMLGTLHVLRPDFHYRLDAFLCHDATGAARAADDAEEAGWFPVPHVIGGRYLMSRDVDRLCLRAMGWITSSRPVL